ncbi:acyl carrier protein [Dictyostelium discoideum AX4]|uniref:Acyl carrier protein, mitochondrial n=1 Tax=Dictyostelium discoideum TaxID=44689 RepID=ACPM_DICDI|nr:acyl carrier protein [Dictyostelium discoideum AX4]Q54E22.1 RecName: Full=Acyl carrier protein, mitochondrial; Short=ACP; AltName: Full=NADH-ubiquinone oxidoreductase subunit AB1; Flags: Precursor [Dictyostelium discoideum]EAL61463.1 acyl carrier protein [Dictyostelium discoideum AX4]|eukprot:XP_629874.1 acyl carrier protein [Dictyostelium discoideum AX4]
MIRNTFKLVSNIAVRPAFSSTFVRQPIVASSMMVRNYGSISEKEITDRVIGVVSQYDKVSGKTVTPTTTFKELGLDSLDSADILVAVEEEFGIEIPDEEADKITSCAETISYLRKTPTAK